MKNFTKKEQCREDIYKGIELVYENVCVTIGPHGRNVLIDRGGQVVDLTKDGVTVAAEVDADGWTGMGCKLIKAASYNTNDEAGDGTTSTIVLGREMCKNAKRLDDTVRVISVKDGIDKAVKDCVEYIKSVSKPVDTEEEFRKVATISSQSPEVGKIVAKAFMDAGENGSIEIERGDEPGILVEKTTGISFDKGYILPHATNKGNLVIQEDIPVLVTDGTIHSQNDLVPIMQALLEKKIPRLIVIADEFKPEVLGMMAKNLVNKAFHIIGIRAPSYGRNKIELLKDICAATGAEFISEENGGLRVETADIDMLGKARKVTIEREKTVLIADDIDEVKKNVFGRIESISESLEEEKDELKKEDLKNRLAILTDGITVLKVGAKTEAERHELRRRVEDATEALSAAREEGVVAGCGVTFLGAHNAIQDHSGDEQIGVEIVKKSLPHISLKVLEVAGIQDKEKIVSDMKESGKGYNFKTGKLGDMLKLGVYDAAKVNRVALENAASVAKNFLTLEAAIMDKPPTELETLFRRQ